LQRTAKWETCFVTVTVMKEIDFLPEWYKSGRRRQINYRTQYVALGGVFVVMMVWSFAASHSISKTRAEITRSEPKQAEAERISVEFAVLKSQVSDLQKKANVLKEIDPESSLNVANVLGEISFLIDKKIVLTKVRFKAEKFADRQFGTAKSRTAVRAAGGNFGGKEATLLGDVRFKVVINGVASEASGVARLICKLEDSPYFCQVIPSFSRNSKLKVGDKTDVRNLKVTDFEISCYLANYVQDEPYFVKEVSGNRAGRQ